MNKELIEATVAAPKAMASMFTSIEELAKTATAGLKVELEKTK